MQRMVKILFIAVIVITMLGMNTQSYAQDPARKLGRGLVNIVTGWIELPRNIYDTAVEENVLTGITVGLTKGVGMTVVRTAAGVYETVTFPFPIPENYQPVLEPEFVFSE